MPRPFTLYFIQTNSWTILSVRPSSKFNHTFFLSGLLYCISSSSSSSSLYIFHGVGILVDPFRFHVSRSLFKGLQWLLRPDGEAKVSNPTTGLTLLWARNPFPGNFNHWQVSREEAGQIFFKRQHIYEDENVALVEWHWQGKTEIVWSKTCFVPVCPPWSHMDWPKIEPEPQRWEAGDWNGSALYIFSL